MVQRCRKHWRVPYVNAADRMMVGASLDAQRLDRLEHLVLLDSLLPLGAQCLATIPRYFPRLPPGKYECRGTPE
jgi:hypothetical protein